MTIEKIAVFTDFSENAAAAVRAAVETAAAFGARLSVVHVIPPVINPVIGDIDWPAAPLPDTSLVERLETRLRQEVSTLVPAGLEWRVLVRQGHVSSEIVSFLVTQGIDLAVVGAFGLSGMGLVIFGSVAKRVAHRAPCSVMIVRPAGTVT